MISEFHLYKIISELFEDYTIFPPSTVKNIDFLLAKDPILLEVKSSILGIYSATKQLISLAHIAKIYDIPVIAITLPPDTPSEGIPPILYFFKKLEEYKITYKELWILNIKETKIYRFIQTDKKPISISLKCPSQILRIHINKPSLLEAMQKIEY